MVATAVSSIEGVLAEENLVITFVDSAIYISSIPDIKHVQMTMKDGPNNNAAGSAISVNVSHSGSAITFSATDMVGAGTAYITIKGRRG